MNAPPSVESGGSRGAGVASASPPAGGLNVVILTSGGAYARQILEGLTAVGLHPCAVLVAGPSVGGGRAQRVRRYLRRPSRALAQQVLRKATAKLDRLRRPFRGGAYEFRHVGALNGEAMVRALRELEPDLLVLAGTGIVKAPVLSVARIGTLNVHPGLLPGFLVSG